MSLIKFIDACVSKYGQRYLSFAKEAQLCGRGVVCYGGKTSKGMKFMKYYDQETEKLVGYAQSFKGQTKMTIYDLFDRPVFTMKIKKDGSISRPRNITYDELGLQDVVNEEMHTLSIRYGCDLQSFRV